jgi:hypothetical protein
MDWIKIKESRGWFRKPLEFKMLPGERLTKIPVVEPRKFSFLYLLWLRYTPEVWKRYKRHRSHMKFLDWCAYPKNANIRSTFGTKEYIEAEKIRVVGLPPIELNDFDTRVRSDSERRESFRKTMREAFNEAKGKVKE